jgi:hypothetical protein
MSEQKNVKFDTIYIGNSDERGVNGEVPLILENIPESETSGIVRSIVNINSNNKVINNKSVLEGELCLLSKNNNKNYIDFEINDNGELIIHGDKANNYHMNEDGELIYKDR